MKNLLTFFIVIAAMNFVAMIILLLASVPAGAYFAGIGFVCLLAAMVTNEEMANREFKK